MKAIILAAGMGSRLGEYTRERPKGMVEFLGKPLIEYQLDVLRSFGIQDISIVRGYLGQKINYDDVTYFENQDFQNSNMIESLFCAERKLEGDVLILYSDIIYEANLLRKVIDFSCQVGVAIDLDFKEYWLERNVGQVEDDESLCLGTDGLITNIGNPSPLSNQMDGRYIGIIKLDAEGCDEVRRVYNMLSSKFAGIDRPWRNSSCFRKGYMTDFLQELIDLNYPVSAIAVCRGWLEVDTENDLRRYTEWHKTGFLNRFIKL